MSLTGGAALLVTLVLTACTSPASAPSTSTAGTTSQPVDIRLVVNPEPVWRLPDPDKVKSVDEALIVGDHLILTPVTNMPLTVVDLTAGKVAWTLDGFRDELAPGISSRALPRAFAIDGVLPVAFWSDCGGETPPKVCRPNASSAAGVAGLDLASGDAGWLRAIDDLNPGEEEVLFGLAGGDVEVVGGDRHTIIANVWWSDTHATTVGLDARSGAVRWSRDGFAAAEAVGPVVLGTAQEAENGRVFRLATWAAIDVTTGKDAWQVELTNPHRVAGRSSDLVVLQSDSDGKIVTVDTASGRRHDLGTPFAHIECPRQVVPGPLACSVAQRDTRIFIQDLTDPTAPKAAPAPLADGGVTAQAGETVFVSAMPYPSLNKDGQGSYAAALDGTRISDIWPGTVMAATDKWVALAFADPKTYRTIIEVRSLRSR